MTSKFVNRIRFLAAGQDDPHSVELDAAADRIEQLETLVSYLAGTNECHVRVMLKGNPIVCDEIILKARAALKEGKDEQ